MTRSSSIMGSAPDSGFIQFEVRDDIRRITCKVSDEALEAVSGLQAPSTPVSRRKSFDRFRTLIDAAAKLKLKTLPPDFAGPVALTSGDLRSVPPSPGAPPFGSVPRGA